MAEQQTHYEMVAVDAKDILADRQAEWHRFTRFVTWGTAATALLLILMAIFLV